MGIVGEVVEVFQPGYGFRSDQDSFVRAKESQSGRGWRFLVQEAATGAVGFGREDELDVVSLFSCCVSGKMGGGLL